MKTYDVVIYNYPSKGDRTVLMSKMDINMAHSVVASCDFANTNPDYHYAAEETSLLDKEK